MENVAVRISNGKNRIYDYRTELNRAGFEFNERQYSSFYEKRMPEENADEWVAFCKKYRLRCDVIPEQYMRSGDYRKEFFKETKPVTPAKYRCAYCGRKLTYKQVQVDHVIPVNKMSYDKGVRFFAKQFGIENVNDTKNLVSSCRHCNLSKGTKMGMWVWRGFLGKSELLWKIRIGLRWTVGIGVAAYLGSFIIKQPDVSQMIVRLVSNTGGW